MNIKERFTAHDANLAYIWYDLMNEGSRTYALRAMLFVLCSSAVLVAVPYAIGMYVDGLTNTNATLLLAGGIAFGSFALMSILLGWFSQDVRERFFQQAFWHMPQAITRQYLERPLAWLSDGSSEIDGSGVSSLQQRVWNVTGSYIFSIVPGWGVIIFSVCACFYAHPALGTVAGAFVALEQYLGRRSNEHIHREMKPVIDEFKRYDRRMNEWWKNVDHVKTQGVETKLLHYIYAMVQDALRGDDAVWRVYFNRFMLWHRLRGFLFGLSLYGLIGFLVLEETLSLAIAVLVLFSFERIRIALMELTNLQRDVQFDMTSLAKYRRVLQQPTPHTFDHGVPFMDDQIAVAFVNVSHTVTTRTGEKTILRDVSLDIPVGMKVGVVGPSGAGKSQLLSLLVRASDPVAGRVLINEHDMRSLRTESLLRQVAVIMQKSEPYEDTILGNQAFVLSHEDLPCLIEQLEEQDRTKLIRRAELAMSKAGLSVQEFAAGVHENIGYKGLTLSGGQQMRLQIAAAHLKLMTAAARGKSCLLLADEPTAPLDSLSERTVMQHLKEELPEYTTMLMVAHRLSTVTTMDQIIFVRPLSHCDSGMAQVTIHNSLSELYEQEPLFRDMADAQQFQP